jgi:hypothetical protein
MKLLATRRDGSTQVLDLQLPIKSADGTHMWRIIDAHGTDYFFNVDDGTYDGWGRAVSSNAEAQELMEEARKSKETPKVKVQ